MQLYICSFIMDVQDAGLRMRNRWSLAPVGAEVIAVRREGLMSRFKKHLSFMPSFLALIFLTEVLRSHY